MLYQEIAKVFVLQQIVLRHRIVVIVVVQQHSFPPICLLPTEQT